MAFILNHRLVGEHSGFLALKALAACELSAGSAADLNNFFDSLAPRCSEDLGTCILSLLLRDD
jgi:hypothetical protein